MKTENGKTTMTLHEGLASLKLYEARISRAYQGKDFVFPVTAAAENYAGKPVKELEAEAEGAFKSTTDLIENRNLLKNAIVESNARNKVTIAGKEYSIAAAIDRKNNISLEKDFLNYLKRQYASVTQKIKMSDDLYPAKLEQHLNEAFAKAQKRNVDDEKAFSDLFAKNNKLIMIDPLKLSGKIEELEKSIEEFENEVDYAMSIANSTNEIEVTFL